MHLGINLINIIFLIMQDMLYGLLSKRSQGSNKEEAHRGGDMQRRRNGPILPICFTAAYNQLRNGFLFINLLRFYFNYIIPDSNGFPWLHP